MTWRSSDRSVLCLWITAIYYRWYPGQRLATEDHRLFWTVAGLSSKKFCPSRYAILHVGSFIKSGWRSTGGALLRKGTLPTGLKLSEAADILLDSCYTEARCKIIIKEKYPHYLGTMVDFTMTCTRAIVGKQPWKLNLEHGFNDLFDPNCPRKIPCRMHRFKKKKSFLLLK